MTWPGSVRIASPDELPVCLEIRREVFIREQNVPESEEIDGRDPDAIHFLATLGDRPVGTARLRFVDQDQAKVERVAVVGAARGRGIGAALMAAVEAEAKRRGAHTAVLGAQVPVIPFYERLGYEAEGPVFLDAGIEHRHMRRQL